MVGHSLVHAEPRGLSRAEYDRMAELGFFRGERVELIRGIVVRMASIGPPHADVIERLTELLVPPLVGRARVRIQLPFLAGAESEPEPDVAIVAATSHAAEHPRQTFLLIEVADSSLAYDRETKGPLYAASGVPEYWIVDVGARAIEVYAVPVEGRYTRFERFEVHQEIRPAAFGDVTVSIASLFG